VSHTEAELWGLLEQAYEMPFGAARIALVEQVIAQADAQHFEELSFQARLQATTSYVYGGEPARSFVTFSWCLAEFDREPMRYASSRHSLLWQFKATITGLTKFSDVPLERTYAVLDEMERRWREGGHSLHAVFQHRHFVARHVGDEAAADQWYGRWCTAPRDDLSDCQGCDPSAKVAWLVQRGRDEEAIELAQPVLAGRLTCSEQPQGILTVLMRPYLRTGRLDEARDAHRQAYRRHRPNLADLGDIAGHVEFCALSGNEARGLEIVERHLGWLDRAPSPLAAMWFAASAALLLRRAAEAGHADVLLRRPARDGERPAEISAEQLQQELTTFALQTAGRFDARNGTDYQAGQITETLQAEPIVEHLPLSAVRSARRSPPVPPAPVVPTLVVPPDAGPDELLDLAEDQRRRGRRPEARAAYEAFDTRYAGAELTTLQRGRRADGHGVDAAARGEMAEAEAAWRSALALFAEAGDELRRQSTRGRIGRVMCDSGRGDTGLGWVEESATYLLAHAPQDRWSGALYSLAVAYGDVGRADQALPVLDRAEEYLAANLDASLPAAVAMSRAQFLGALDRPAEARDAAQEAVRRSQAADFGEGVAHGSYLAGLAAEQLGELGAAVAAYDGAIAASDATGLVELARHVRLQRASLLAGTPQASSVLDDLIDAVADRVSAADYGPAARVRHELAIAYLNAGRPLDSADVGEEALAWFLASDDDDAPHRAIALRHLLATAYQRLDQPDEAINQLELISADCAERDNPAGVGQMAEEIGDILDLQDRDAAAALRYLTAAEAFRAADLPLDEFRNRRQHATSLLWAGDVEAALSALEAADHLSLSQDDSDQARWERASLLYDGAKILRNAGRLDEATLRAEGAAAAFRASGHFLQAAHAEMVHAELLLRGERPDEAAAAAQRGLADLPSGEDGRERLEALLAAAREAQAEPG
jgi:hypothetical protein